MIMDVEDKIIIDGLITRDNIITSNFLKKYRPLFINAISVVFDYSVDMDECINELYLYLMKDEAAKLKSFEGRCTLGAWLKIVTIRFFKDLRDANKVIDNISKEPLFENGSGNSENEVDNTLDALEAKKDIEQLFRLMKNERYVMVIRSLILEDKKPEYIARFMGITVANLYNIKKRALKRMAEIAINEKREYGNK